MSTPTAPSFLDLLRQSRLLDPEQVDEIGVLPQAQGIDTGTLTKCLIQLGLLTSYQVDQLLAGKGPTLTVGRYQVIGRLETAGSPAYLVRHRDRAGKFVLKPLPAGPAGASFWPQLEQEAGQAGRIRHPHLEAPTEVGIIDFKRVYVRPYVEGIDLGRRVREGGPLTYARACELIRQAAEGMSHAHAKGLTHRRLRPNNLILVQTPGAVGGSATNGQADAALDAVKIVDLGLGGLPNDRKAPAPAVPGGTDPSVCQDVRDLGRTFGYLLGLGAGARPAAGEPIPVEVVAVVKQMQTTGPDSGFRSLAEVADAVRPWCPPPPPPPPELTGEFPALPTVSLPALPPEIEAFTIGEPESDPTVPSGETAAEPPPCEDSPEANGRAVTSEAPAPLSETIPPVVPTTDNEIPFVPAPPEPATAPDPEPAVPSHPWPEVTAFVDAIAQSPTRAEEETAPPPDYPPPELLFSPGLSVESPAPTPAAAGLDTASPAPAQPEAPWPDLRLSIDEESAAPDPAVAHEPPATAETAAKPPEGVASSSPGELSAPHVPADVGGPLATSAVLTEETHNLDFAGPSSEEPAAEEDLASYVGKAPPRRTGRRKRGAYFWWMVAVGALLWLIVIVLAVVCYFVFTAPAPKPSPPNKNPTNRRPRAAMLSPRESGDRWIGLRPDRVA